MVGVYAFASDHWGGPWSLEAANAGTWSAVYISLAASAAALLGFAITAISILSTLGDGPRITWLRKQEAFQQTRFVFMASIRALGAATLLYTGLILIDDDAVGRAWWEAAGVGLLVLVVTRIAWVIWLLNEIVHLAPKNEAATSQTSRPFTEPLDDPP